MTFHGGNARLGWDASETVLTPASVRADGFGKLWDQSLDGAVTGSPLYVSRLEIAGKPRRVVYAATAENSVYALDAANGHLLWARRRLGKPPRDWRGRPQMGILSTPVIDRQTQTLYACGVCLHGLRQVYQVWALDLRTGALRPGWPVTLAGADRGCRFDGGQLFQRGALTLDGDALSIAFGGRGDAPPWHGWVVQLDVRHPSAPARAFCASPHADGAGIWSGGGLSADADHSLYAVTGNGDTDVASGGDSLAQSVLRLHTDLTFTRDPRDFYTPENHQFLNDEDEDLGGATALVLPDQPIPAAPHLLFVGGKDGLGYVLNRDSLGGVGGALWKRRLFSKPDAVYHEGIRSTACYFDAGEAGRFLYVAGDEPGPDGSNGLLALRLTADPAGKPQLDRAWTLPASLDGPSSPTLSSHGPANGIVWIVECKSSQWNGPAHPSALRAYDALTGAELYNSDRRPADHLTDGRRFTSPIVADGRVFVGANGVACYGRKED